jgi:hypothetical protein
MTRTRSTSVGARILCASVVCLPLLAGCSNNGDPYGYVKVSGTVTYDDGSKIPLSEMYVYFYSEAPAVGNLHPRYGTVAVDKNGAFRNVTTHTPFDGIVRGKHKVTLRGGNDSALPASIVPPEYCDVKKTPLEVDTSQSPFQLKVKKPAAR